MPELKLKVEGYKRATVNASWETHIVDSTLHTVFSGFIDGFDVNLYVLNSIDPSMIIRKSGIIINSGEQFTIDDINNGIIEVEYLHSTAQEGSANFSVYGQARYDMNFIIYSIV